MTPEDLLRERGATDLEHPGGTLLAHLRRVRLLLAEWGASEHLQTVGLGHAFYGTDGFGVALVDVTTERDLVRQVVGAAAEAAIHLYASCDRRHLYPQAGLPVVSFRDRWSGVDTEVPSEDLRDFWELSFANELDIVRQSDDLLHHLGPQLWELWSPARPWVTDEAWACFEGLLHSDP